MQRVVIDIPDNKFTFFMELVNNLGFENVKRISNEQQEFVEDLEHSLQQVEQHQKGKIELQTAKEFLDEL
jgi:hypothetical protein